MSQDSLAVPANFIGYFEFEFAGSAGEGKLPAVRKNDIFLFHSPDDRLGSFHWVERGSAHMHSLPLANITGARARC